MFFVKRIHLVQLRTSLYRKTAEGLAMLKRLMPSQQGVKSTGGKNVRKGEEVVIMRRGTRIARLVPIGGSDKRLPDLKDFRDSITIKGDSLGNAVIQGRNEKRF